MEPNLPIAPQFASNGTNNFIKTSSKPVNNDVNKQTKKAIKQRPFANDNSTISQKEIGSNEHGVDTKRRNKKKPYVEQYGELGSIARPGSKKGNIEIAAYRENNRNDQANFNQRRHASLRHFWDESENNDVWAIDKSIQHQRTHACYNKERFLQANCQFVVLDDCDYNSHVRDPDLLVEWDKIQELRTFNMVNCAICLSQPVAAKMTRCGHIYCFPCLLHYAALSDNPWRKCPICFEPIYVAHLRSVTARDSSLPAAKLKHDDVITMQLMQRDKKSTIVMPVETFSLKHSFEVAIDQGTKMSTFAKILKTSVQHVLESVIAREKSELLAKLLEEEDEPESVFVKQALKDVAKREEELNMASMGIRIDSVKDKEVIKQDSSPAIVYVDSFNEVVESMQEVSLLESPASDQGSPRANQSLTPPAEAKSFDAASSTAPSSSLAYHQHRCNSGNQYLYFYQMHDGQLVFLSTLNTRTLIDEYDQLANAPQQISGKLLNAQHLVMSGDLRLRYKHLAHLPIGTSFILAELRLDDGLLSPNIVRQYQAEFDKRAHERRKRHQQETRNAHRAEKWQLRQMFNSASYSVLPANHRDVSPEAFVVPRYVNSAHHELEAQWTAGPEPHVQDDMNLLADEYSPPLGIDAISIPMTPPTQVQQIAQSPVMSFAEMLRAKPKQPAQTVWGKAVTSTTQSTMSKKNAGQVPSVAIQDDVNEYAPPSTTNAYTQMWLSDMLNQPVAQQGKKSKKKNKKEKIVL